MIYTLSLLKENRSARLFREKRTGAYWALALLMSVLWLGSVVVYGNGVTEIGSLGLIIGWPVFMSGAVIAGAAWSTLFGEWRDSGRTAKAAMAAGVICLMIAIAILGKTPR